MHRIRTKIAMMIIQSRMAFCATQNASRATAITDKGPCVGVYVHQKAPTSESRVRREHTAEELVNR